MRKGFFEHAEFLELRSHLPEHLRTLVTFGYYTGCRKGEILNLRWNQVDLAKGLVRLEPGETKNAEGRTIPLRGELKDMLSMLKEQNSQHLACPFVFSYDGKAIRSFYSAWAKACLGAGLVDELGKSKRLFHDLRRTGVRNLIRSGSSELVAMRISGHKTRAVLDRYNIVDERDIHVAGDKLEAYLAAQSEAHKAKTKPVPGAQAQGEPDDYPKLLN